MFSLENSLLKEDIDRIINYPHDGTNEQTYKLFLHTVDHDIEITTIDSIETMRDYNGNHTDYTLTDYMIPVGDFIKFVYPKRDNLEVTLIKKSGNQEYTIKYKAILMNTDFNNIGNVTDTMSLEDLNKLGYMEVTMQLLYREVEIIRNMESHGIYNNTNIKDVIISSISDVLSRCKMTGANIDLSLSIVTPNNIRKYDHIVIPNGINILDLPSYLDHKDYGVYNGYIGTYVQYYNDKLTLFIYPLYNHIKSKGKDKELIIYQVNSKQYEVMDRTYIIDGNTISILANDSSTRIDSSDDKLINKGTGFRTPEPNSLLNRSINVSEGKIESDSKTSVHKFRLKDMDDQIVQTKLVKATDNMYIERSKILKNTGSFLQLQWNFSYSELLYPGMPVTYIYVKDKDIIKRKGVLQSVYIQNKPHKKMSVSILNVFIENLSKGYENE